MSFRLKLTPASAKLEEAVSRVQPAVESIIAQLRSLTKAPDEMRIEFGLDLHAEAGAFIAAVSEGVLRPFGNFSAFESTCHRACLMLCDLDEH